MARTAHRDMTKGAIWKNILFFALPAMCSSLFQQLYNTVDGIVVGNHVSQNALSAVSGCAPATSLLLSIAIGLSTGGGVVVAQYFGGKRTNEMRRTVSTLAITLFVLGLCLSLFGVCFSHFLVSTLLGVKDPEVLELSVLYFRIFSCGMVFSFLYNVINASLRALGDSKSLLLLQVFSSLLHICLDLLFVLKFNWGVAGVATATCISQFCCLCFSVVYALKRYPVFRFKREEFVFDKTIFKFILRLGIPSAIEHSVVSLGQLFVQRLVNSFGPNTMASFGVGHRIENYTMLPLFSFNAGLSTFVGQNIGAGQLDRAKKGIKVTVPMTVIFTLIMMPVLYFLGPSISALFGIEGEALQQCITQLRYMAFVLVVFAIYNPTIGFLNGSGDAMWATAASFTSLGVRVITAYVAVYLFSGDYRFVWATQPIGWFFAATVGYLRFFTGGWKKKALVKYEEKAAKAQAAETPSEA